MEVQGESVKVIKALESVVGHLRKFLVDHSVLPLFEKNVSSCLSSCIMLYFKLNLIIMFCYFIYKVLRLRYSLYRITVQWSHK